MKARGPVRYRVEKATAVIAAKQATSIIPIVFAIAADPIGTGLVASLARLGGNVTGLSIQSTDVAAKRLALLREVVPSLRRLAIVANFGNPASALESGEVQTAARALGLEVITVETRRAEPYRQGHSWYVRFRWGNCSVPLQTLVRLLKEEDGGVFDPEDIAIMATAFDRLVADLKLVKRDDPIVTMLAKLVIELVRNGERDPDKIRQQVIGRYKAQ